MRNSNVNTRGTIFQKSVQLLADADDIDVIGRTQRAVNEAFASIEAEAAKMMHNIDVIMGSRNFEVVKDFVLGSRGN